MDTSPKEQLQARARAGDRAAAAELFAPHHDDLLRLVELRLGRRLAPSDGVQAAPSEAVRRLGAYLEQAPMPFRLWLRQIAYDRVQNVGQHDLAEERRDAGREAALPERSSLALAHQLLASEPTPSEQVGLHQLADRLREAITALPKSDREVLLLRSFEGLSHEEIGNLLSLDAVTVRKRYGRALIRLHQLLFGGRDEAAS